MKLNRVVINVRILTITSLNWVFAYCGKSYLHNLKKRNMKSNFTLLLPALVLAFGGSAFCQNRQLIVPEENYSNGYVDYLSSPASDSPDGVAVNDVPTAKPRFTGERSGGGPIWSEDFGNGFPQGWAVDDVSGINPWKWSENGSHGYWNGSNGDDYGDPINSTTSGNGFLISDPDSANHFNYGQPSGTTYEYLESYFATNAIDLGGSYPSLLLEFEQSFRFNNSVDLVVMASADSINWTEYTVQGGTNNNTASADPELVSVNISGAVGSSQVVYLKIGWNARVYFWMIDDMRIVEGLGNDLIVEKAFHGNVIEDWEYEITPLGQVASKELGVVVNNNGGNVQSNVMCEYAIVLNGDTVDDGIFTVNDGTIGPAETDTGWYDTGYFPDEVGLYSVHYKVTSESQDEEPLNNSFTRDFEINEYEWSHEREDLWDGQYGAYYIPNSDPQELAAYSHGSVFYPVADADLTAIKVSFGSLTSATSSSPIALTVEVHEIGQNIQDIVDSEIQLADLESAGWQTFILDDPITLVEGVGYILAVSSPGEPDIMTIDGWGLDDDFGGANYGPFGTGGAENWYNGWDYSSAIRAVFNPALSVPETQTANNAFFSLYPNPASGAVQVNVDGNVDLEQVSIVDVTGKLVVSSVVGLSQKLSLDVSQLEPGIYFVNGSSKNHISTQKLIIQ